MLRVLLLASLVSLALVGCNTTQPVNPDPNPGETQIPGDNETPGDDETPEGEEPIPGVVTFNVPTGYHPIVRLVAYQDGDGP